MTGLLRISDDLALPLEAVTETFAVLAKRGAGKTHTASVLVEELIDAGQPVCVIDPVGVWWGLRSSADGEHPGKPVVIFGGDHADLPLPAEAGAAIADVVMDERIPAVLDLSHLSKTKGRDFVRAFMERLYFRNREPLHLVVDEADLFAPQRGGADTARLVGAYEDIVRRGRARGIGCTSITQRPASLHKDILTQSEVLIALRMTGVRDVAAINEWVQLHAEDDEAKQVRSSLAALPVGTAWVWSPGWLGLLRKVQIRRRRTFDSSATPKPGERVVAPTRFADVDLARLRERLTALEGDAKPPGPRPAGGDAETARLRKRVADLERELVSALGMVKTVEVPVPVVTDEQIRSLTMAVEYLDAAMADAAECARPIREALARLAANPAPSAEAERPSSRPEPAPRLIPTGDGNGQRLAKAERAILTVLAQHGRRSTVQVALLTGYSHKSGGFRNALSSLRSAGHITGRGDVVATGQGLDALGVYEPLPAGRALVEWWFGQLGRAERMILEVVVKAWPNAIGTDEIAAYTGYSATSGGFRNALSRLRSLQLAEGRGVLRAADTLGAAWSDR